MTSSFRLARRLLTAAALVLPMLAGAQEAAIRKNLGERVPGMQKIDEISKTPMAGLYEVRMGNDVLYTDAEGNFLIQGSLLDTKARKNLTDERIEKLTAIDFAQLPAKGAFTMLRGNGKRKLAVFEDPNCGYCKRFEKDLQSVDNVTVSFYLVPILGPDSVEKTRNIWCSADKVKTWNDWMLRDVQPKAATCNTDAITANVEFAKKYRITGTPTLIFADGTRVPGAINAQQIEKLLAR